MRTVNLFGKKLNIRHNDNEDKIYLSQLTLEIENDFDKACEELNQYNDSLERMIEKSKEHNIEDEYLIIKSEEHIERIHKILRKSKKYRRKKLKTTQEVYECYVLVREINDNKLTAKEYLNQLNRYVILNI